MASTRSPERYTNIDVGNNASHSINEFDFTNFFNIIIFQWLHYHYTHKNAIRT